MYLINGFGRASPGFGLDLPIGSGRLGGCYNYRHKLWNDSLDQVNSNLVNIHNVLIELEGFVNNLAHRQDELVTMVEYTNEYCLFQREEPPTKEKPDISIPKFHPSLATFNLEPLNLKTSKSYKRRR